MDIETVRLRAEFLALETLVTSFLRHRAEQDEAFAADLRHLRTQGGEKLTRLHPKGVSAEQGDLLMAELQEAWERLMQRVLPRP